MHTRHEPSAREIGYWVHKDFIRQGIATEIVCGLSKLAFEIEGLNRLEIRCDIANKPSAGVPEKCGFKLREILKGGMKDVYGKERDTMIWEMKREDYLQSKMRNFELRAFDINGAEMH